MAERLRLGLPLSHPLDAGPRRAAAQPGEPPAADPTPPAAPPPVTDDDRRIADAYREGHSIHALAALTGYSPAAVRKALRRQGVVRRPRGRTRLPPEVEVRMAELYRGGQSIAAVAARTGYGPTTVWISLVRQGVALRPPGRPPP
jgi:transposase-like protein